MAFKTKAEIEGEWGFRWRYILRALQRYAAAPKLLDVGADGLDEATIYAVALGGSR